MLIWAGINPSNSLHAVSHNTFVKESSGFQRYLFRAVKGNSPVVKDIDASGTVEGSNKRDKAL